MIWSNIFYYFDHINDNHYFTYKIERSPPFPELFPLRVMKCYWNFHTFLTPFHHCYFQKLKRRSFSIFHTLEKEEPSHGEATRRFPSSQVFLEVLLYDSFHWVFNYSHSLDSSTIFCSYYVFDFIYFMVD